MLCRPLALYVVLLNQVLFGSEVCDFCTQALDNGKYAYVVNGKLDNRQWVSILHYVHTIKNKDRINDNSQDIWRVPLGLFGIEIISNVTFVSFVCWFVFRLLIS